VDAPQKQSVRALPDVTHLFGHELRLEVSGELAQSQVCRTDAEILDTQERWRHALEEEGWRR
jgi:hypothetical protein